MIATGEADRYQPKPVRLLGFDEIVAAPGPWKRAWPPAR